MDSVHATFIVRFDPHFIVHCLSQFPVLEPGGLYQDRTIRQIPVAGEGSR